MFRWRRKNEGFEWREYVRTTIKVRREDRAKKIEEIKLAAHSGAMDAGRNSINAGKRGAGALRSWLGAATWRIDGMFRAGSVRASSAVVTSVRSLWRFVRDGRALSLIPGRLTLQLSARSKISMLFGVLALVAGISAYLQFATSGWQWSTFLAALVAAILVCLTLMPWLSSAVTRLTNVVRGWWRGGSSVSLFAAGFGARLAASRKWVVASAAVLVAGVSGMILWQGGQLAAASSSILSALPISQQLPDIKGRGRAVSGDTVRIGRKIVRLANIEAPETAQVCRDKRGRAWSCGRRSRSQLRRVLRGKSLVCTDVVELTGQGLLQGTCRAGGRDVAQVIVEKGYAFARGMIVKTYAEAETKAKAAKRGIWQGEAQSPADFRAARWAAATKAAPDGCPIKGRVVRKSKVYVVPWALDYRQVRVRHRRGERWFCTEQEATRAGFKPSSTG